MNYNYFGYIGCLLISLSIFPKTYQRIQSNQWENVTIWSNVTICASCSTMLIYSVKMNLYPIFCSSILVLINEFIHLCYYCNKKCSIQEMECIKTLDRI